MPLVLALALFPSTFTCKAQVFPSRISTYLPSDTNVLSPVPFAGTLIIDYDFVYVPDTLDVYYDGKDIYSSGLVSGIGQFNIPYGPGDSTSLTIVMNQDNFAPGTAWAYTPTVVPEPGTLLLLFSGIALIGFFKCRRH